MDSSSPLFSSAPERKSWYERINIWWALVAGALLAVLLIWSCGRRVYADYKTGDHAVAVFHQRLDREKYDEIFDNTTEEFRRAGTQEDQIAFFENVHQKMGSLKQARLAGFNFNTNNTGTTFVLTYNSEFARGSGQEVFTWFMKDGSVKLNGYHIEAPNLK